MTVKAATVVTGEIKTTDAYHLKEVDRADYTQKYHMDRQKMRADFAV